MEIRTQSTNNRETITKFTKTHLIQKLPLFLSIDFLYFLAILNSSRSLAFAFILFIVFNILMVIPLAIIIRQQYKIMGKLQEATYYYLFRDNDFTCSIRTIDGGFCSQTVIHYTFPVKAIETDFFLYIYINRNSAYIIDKRTIENGTIDNIRCKLMPLLGKKYKIIK